MIDHIIYASPDLSRGVRKFAADYGIEPTVGGKHLGFGTRNALIGLGKAGYLEILGVDGEQDVAPPKRFLHLERATQPGYIAWCARADRPLQETLEVAHTAGYDLGEMITMSREKTDGTTMRWKLTPFADRNGVLPLYIDWGNTPNPATLLPSLLTLVSLTLVHPDANRIRTILAALGEEEPFVELGPEPELRVNLRR